MNTMDLHMHSDYSCDGTYRPAKLMDLCKEAGMTTVALTDHDCARGNREAAARAKELGIRFVPGVELNCVCQGYDLHLLGYGIDSDDKRMLALEEHSLELSRKGSADRMQILKELGIYFDEEKLWAESWKGKIVPHQFAKSALADERNRNHPLMKELFPGGSRSDNAPLNFFWDVCALGKPAYVKINHISFEEAHQLIMDLGGVSVLAHPGQSIGKDPEVIRYMVGHGLEGIEINCSYHTEEQSLYYEELARELHALKTPGSDFHGTLKPNVHMGQVLGNIYEEDVEALLRMIQERR